MDTNQENINQLLEKLEALLKKQDEFSKEIQTLRTEIYRLKPTGDKPVTSPPAEPEKTQQTPPPPPPRPIAPPPVNAPKKPSNAEKFIGENLISKIGIIITVIGVSIGVKYAIDHELISPLTRIILGYLFGAGLLVFAMALKKNYEKFSAVLLSGAIAILYFITYAAYGFYELIPQALAFGLMVVFTGFAVVAALRYDQQVIAHLGLVGAYAVPFLLSNDSGQVEVLFSYTAIINTGILMIAFRKYWKPIYYSAFLLTWLIYFSWYVTSYQTDTHFGLGIGFLFLFFAIFYLTFLSYKLLRKEQFQFDDILLLLSNSFVFYGIGYAILNDHETGRQLLGLFTLGNAVVHFAVAYTIHRNKLADRNLFYLVAGLVLTFITIAIPVQLDGNWVTLLWAGEAALLFWIGRTRRVPVYEMLSYPLMFLAFFSLLHDWSTVYDVYYQEIPDSRITPVLNIHFLSAMLVAGAFGFIHFLNNNKQYQPEPGARKLPPAFISFSIPAMLLAVLYFTFRIEIATHWNQLYTDSFLSVNENGQEYSSEYHNYDLMQFKMVWIANYSLLFFSLLAFLNIRKLKNQLLGFINLGLLVLAIVSFLVLGLYIISELRDSFLDQPLAEYYQRGAMHVGIRYISLAFLALALAACYRYTRAEFIKPDFRMAYDFLLHTAILWVASSELIHWMDMADASQSYKLGLSILWGSYALLLIALGIWKKKKHLRIGAIGLFGVTLVKLFFYDLASLDTIAKTIVFVSLGVLLLIISFLYNKYKNLIFDDAEN
ncbi:MAG: DUF2339 domain-containing protein [Saprospiraceae bacterium]